MVSGVHQRRGAGAQADPRRARVPLPVLRDVIQPFPTLSEIYVDAPKALHGQIVAARQMGRGGITVNELVAGLDQHGRSTASDLANAEDSSLVALRSMTGFALIAATVPALGSRQWGRTAGGAFSRQESAQRQESSLPCEMNQPCGPRSWPVSGLPADVTSAWTDPAAIADRTADPSAKPDTSTRIPGGTQTRTPPTSDTLVKVTSGAASCAWLRSSQVPPTMLITMTWRSIRHGP